MPVKQHADAPPLSPAWRWSLMSGGFCPQRVPGWVAQAMEPRDANGDYDYQPAGDVLWRQHHDSLTDEAERHGFRPFWVTKKRPTGAGYEAWEAQFIKTFRY